MKKSIKRMFSVVMICLLFLGMASMQAFAAGDSITIAGKNVYVSSGTSYFVNNGSGGLDATGANEDNYNVKYDAATKTLTLKDAAITVSSGTSLSASYYSTQAYIDIRVSHNVKVSVEGTNTFGPTGTNKSAGAVIYADIRGKSLTFEGTGSLTGLGRYYGLCAYSNSDSRIVFNSGNYTFTVADQGSGSPVEGARYSGNMTINGGSVIFDARWTYSSGSSYDAKGINGGTLTMNGGYCKAVGYSRGSTGYALANGWKGTTYNGGCLELYAGLNSERYDCGNKISDEWPFAETDALKNANMEYAKYFDGTNLSTVYPTNYRAFVASGGTYYQAKSYLKISENYSVTYTDGVEEEEVFADQITENLLYGVATPEFEGDLTRLGWTFKGWEPAVSPTVTGNALYTAIWEQNKYTVTYTDGVEEEEIFADQITENLVYGDATPGFEGGEPVRLGWTFMGWEPGVADTVTEDAVYDAIWEQNKYTVTYNDGVEDEEVFADQVTEDLVYGDATPEFEGEPQRVGYTFVGWEPEVADTVTEDAVYTAVWEQNKYTVTYNDGVEDEEVFVDQVTEDLVYGDATPEFEGEPKREGYKFVGWEPTVADTVTESVVYEAIWEKVEVVEELPETGDDIFGYQVLFVLSMVSLVGVMMVSRKRDLN